MGELSRLSKKELPKLFQRQYKPPKKGTLKMLRKFPTGLLKNYPKNILQTVFWELKMFRMLWKPRLFLWITPKPPRRIFFIAENGRRFGKNEKRFPNTSKN